MLKTKVEEVLVNQIEKEAYSSNLYLAMAVWAETNGFEGVSNWLYAQAEEERLHLFKFIRYVNERGGKAVIPAIEQPPTTFASVKDMFDQVLEHETYISELINNIVGTCLQEGDFTTHTWLQWFVTEQIEEEASVRGICDKLALIGDHNLYLFDKDIMGLRAQAKSADSTGA